MLVEVEISDPVVISRQLLISYRHFSLERHELLCTYIYIRAVMSNFLELTYPWMSTQLVPSHTSTVMVQVWTSARVD